MLAIYAPFCRDSPISFETREPTVEAMRHRIAKTLKSLPWLVCEEEGLILGYAYASPHRERAVQNDFQFAVSRSEYVGGRHKSGTPTEESHLRAQEAEFSVGPGFGVVEIGAHVQNAFDRAAVARSYGAGNFPHVRPS